MFGYVRPERETLLCKEYDFYRATYCGICREMKKTTGLLSPTFLEYDSVYLALLRMAYLPDGDFSSHTGRCVAHPFRSRVILDANPAISYTARAFSLLAYHKLRDDLADETFARRTALLPARPVVAGAHRRASLAELDGFVAGKLAAIRALENEKCDSVDRPADLFGDLLSRVFSFGTEGEAATVLGTAGFHLGRFIYAADAAEDYERDRKSGAYNPYVVAYGGEELTSVQKDNIRTALILSCEGVGQAVEFLPFGTRDTLAGLVRNITYRGLVRRVDFLKEQPKKGDEG